MRLKLLRRDRMDHLPADLRQCLRRGLLALVDEVQAMLLRQPGRIFSAVGDQAFAVGGGVVGRWADQMRHHVDVVARLQLRQTLHHQGRVRIVGLVKIMHLVPLPTLIAAAFSAAALPGQTLRRKPPGGDGGHEQALEVHRRMEWIIKGEMERRASV